MRRVKTMRLWVALIILSLSVTGCASPYLLTKKKKTLDLKPNEGVMLFTCQFRNRDNLSKRRVFSLLNTGLQENNQYKDFKKKTIFFVPCSSYNSQDDLLLFSLKLKRGSYRITDMNGIFPGLFGSQYFAGVNKLFDVLPGRVSYGGRLYVDFFTSTGGRTHETSVKDLFEEDEGRFKSDYPALQGRTIVKDLIY